MEKQQKHILIALIMLVFANIFGVLTEKACCATPAEIEQWLQAHNDYRALHGSPDVTWNTTVEASAQAYANTCPSGHSGSGYGENIAFATYTQTPQNVVDRWYAEEQYYDYNNPGFSLDPTKAIGHFTQVVWMSTTQIGCGCATGCSGTYQSICVCQYYPAGNVIGQYAANVFPLSGVPGAPSLSSPANGATVSGTSITFSWSTPTGSPTKYHIQVSTSSTFATTFSNNENVVGTSITVSGFPNNGTTYYWRVRAFNSTGWGSWSGTRSFVNGSIATVPGAPTLSSPADGATVSATSITFYWDTPTGSPTKYHFQIATSSTFSPLAWSSDTITGTSQALSSFPNNGTTYYWRVCAYNSVGWGPWSSTRYFVNGSTGTVPGAPTLSSPADGATIAATSITFYWNAPTGSPTQYHLQLSTNSEFASLAYDNNNITDTSRPLTSFPNNGTTYYWRVRAYNSAGWGLWSSTRYFVNGSTASVPGTPTLSSPPNGATVSGTSITFSWNVPTGNPTKYHIQLSTSSTFVTTVASNDNVTGTSITGSGFPNNGSTYYWRVRAGNSVGWGSWSGIRSFVNGGVPAAPTLSSPPNGATVSGTSITFSWNVPTGSPSKYHIQLSTSSTFATTFASSDNVSGTSITGNGFPNTGSTYYWRVRAYNSAGWGAWSGTRSFINGGVPAAPTLSSPANNAKLSDTSVTFKWNASAWATKYWLAVSSSSSFSEDTRVFYGSVGAATSYTLKLPRDGKTYYWAVCAGNSAGWGAWSLYRTLKAPPPNNSAALLLLLEN